MTASTWPAAGTAAAEGGPACAAICGLGVTGADRDTSVSEWAASAAGAGVAFGTAAAAGAIGAAPPMMMQSGYLF